ncbi:MAG: hypothetical protein K0S74_1879 [Chlamydiales bacterium]|jgi:hypothetical protein|nr:hypothetical protein [Chlamydiales bacterium]
MIEFPGTASNSRFTDIYTSNLKTAYLEKLPDSCIINIFSRVQGSSLRSAILVCKSWRNLIVQGEQNRLKRFIVALSAQSILVNNCPEIAENILALNLDDSVAKVAQSTFDLLSLRRRLLTVAYKILLLAGTGNLKSQTKRIIQQLPKPILLVDLPLLARKYYALDWVDELLKSNEHFTDNTSLKQLVSGILTEVTRKFSTDVKCNEYQFIRYIDLLIFKIIYKAFIYAEKFEYISFFIKILQLIIKGLLSLYPADLVWKAVKSIESGKVLQKIGEETDKIEAFQVISYRVLIAFVKLFVVDDARKKDVFIAIHNCAVRQQLMEPQLEIINFLKQGSLKNKLLKNTSESYSKIKEFSKSIEIAEQITQLKMREKRLSVIVDFLARDELYTEAWNLASTLTTKVQRSAFFYICKAQVANKKLPEALNTIARTNFTHKKPSLYWHLFNELLTLQAYNEAREFSRYAPSQSEQEESLRLMKLLNTLGSNNAQKRKSLSPDLMNKQKILKI